MAGPTGSISGSQQTIRSTYEGLFGGQQQSGNPMARVHPALRTPPPGGWPSNISDIWRAIWGFQNRPGGVDSLSPSQSEFHKQWAPFTPPPGTPLPQDLQGIVGRPTALETPDMFQLGPRVASVPGENMGPFAPYGFRQPGSASEEPDYASAV